MIVGSASRARARIVSIHQRWHTAHHSSISKRPLFTRQKRDHDQYYSLRRFASLDGGGGGGDGTDDDWLPPDHSPLFKRTKGKPRPSKLNFDPPHRMGEEIQVIDLEATFDNPTNRGHLPDGSEPSESSETGFEVQSSSVDWKQVLRELKEEGEIEMMEGLVKEYNLQGHLASLDDDAKPAENDDGPVEKSSAEEDEEWDEELEESLRGLSQEEIVDELIENSPSMSQLEVEILSEEMERSERGERDGLDYDTLEDSNWNENAAYRDFRSMVLEDYTEKKRARAQRNFAAREDSAATTNFTTVADLSAYPPDWKDYDSKAAFQRDFSVDDDSWISPSSDLIPSRSLKVDENQGGGGRDVAGDAETPAGDLDDAIDWLQARRSRLGDAPEETKQTPTRLLTPEQAEKFSNRNSQIPVVTHTLFTVAELTASLVAQGGTDVRVIDTSEFHSIHGVGIGCDHIVLVTGRAPSHVRVLADSVVRNLKARRLGERGVVGATMGAEGGQDVFSNRRSRNRARRNGAVNVSGKIDDDWICVDCDNIHVHAMEAITRKCLNIEGLWDVSNPNSEGNKLRRVDFTDDEAVDTYVAENPIPDEYAAKIFDGGGGWISGGTGSRVESVPIYDKKSFSQKWSGGGNKKGKKQRGK